VICTTIGLGWILIFPELSVILSLLVSSRPKWS